MLIAPTTMELPAGVIRLEPLATQHAPDLFSVSRDPEIWRYFPDRQPQSVDEMTTWIQQAIAAQQAGTEVPFAIVNRRSGAAMGSTRYLDIQRTHRSVEIGATWLGAPARRTSVNTECKFLLLQHAFEALGALRVCLKTDARNERSQRAILRIGALYEGRLRRSRVLSDGFVRDTLYYSILDSEWPTTKAALESMLRRS